MAELSATTGLAVATIKYYLREGLLSPGRPIGRNQAEYGPEHVRRLRLVRALIDYGGLGIADIRDLIARLDDPGVGLYGLAGLAQKSVTEREEARPGPHRERARRIVAEVMERKGWQDSAANPAVGTLVGVVAVLEELGLREISAVLGDYADAAEGIARVDLGVVGTAGDRERAVEIVALGTRLGDAIVVSWRRVAQEHLTTRTLNP
ncbi:MerR family transcriptional regulator [Nonomuraea sp. NPDC050790]|uniref:MerR family transcriptional regulator n=1 Tax=Nonomuraea sp. NPDC050790 TaxID=3364371 RepID=UPI0037A3BB9E